MTSSASTPPKRVGQRDRLARHRGEIEMPVETRPRLIRRDDFEKLLLPRRLPHGVEQPPIARRGCAPCCSTLMAAA